MEKFFLLNKCTKMSGYACLTPLVGCSDEDRLKDFKKLMENADSGTSLVVTVVPSFDYLIKGELMKIYNSTNPT